MEVWEKVVVEKVLIVEEVIGVWEWVVVEKICIQEELKEVIVVVEVCK